MSHLANKVAKVTLSASLTDSVKTPNIAVTWSGSIGKEKITEKHLNTPPEVTQPGTWPECSKFAGSVTQRRQVGSKSGNILLRLVLDQWFLSTSLNWMRVCLAFIADECIQARIESQTFSSITRFSSSSSWSHWGGLFCINHSVDLRDHPFHGFVVLYILKNLLWLSFKKVILASPEMGQLTLPKKLKYTRNVLKSWLSLT